MSEFRITATQGGNAVSVEPDAAFSYTDCLNDVNEAELRFSSISISTRTALVMGATLEILKDSTRAFYGLIDHIDYVDGGGLVVHASGHEIWLAKEHGAYANSPWLATASATIFSALIAESTHLSAESIATGLSVDLKVSKSDSLWNAITTLLKKTAQDLFVDYTDTSDIEIGITNHKGSATSIGNMDGGIDFYNLRFTTTYPIANYVAVYGKGDGNDQLMSTSGHGQDATSQSAYGIIKKIVVDRTCIDQTSVDNLADKEVALSKDPTKLYEFQVKDIKWDIEAGDILTITSEDVGLDEEEVRVTRVKRGFFGSTEVLGLQVTNSSFAKAVKDGNKQLGEIRKQIRDTNTYMQGSSNLCQWSGLINGNSSYGLEIPFYIDSRFEDEAGNMRVTSFGVDYDIDKFRESVGTATDSGHDHDLSPGATASHKHDATDGGHNHGVPTLTSSSYTMMSDEGGDSFTGDTLSVGWNNNQLSEAISGTFDFIYVRVAIEADFSDGDFDVGIRLHMGGNYYANRYNMGANTGVHSYVIRETFMFPVFGSSTSTVYADVYSSVNNDYNGELQVHGGGQSHSHSIPDSYDVDNGTADVSDSTKTPALTGDSDSGTASITIGDGVGEAGSVNATSLTVTIDKWDDVDKEWDCYGTNITGDILNWNIDFGGGVYPNSTGWWRIKILTNHATPDLIQAIVKIKHQMDN